MQFIVWWLSLDIAMVMMLWGTGDNKVREEDWIPLVKEIVNE